MTVDSHGQAPRNRSFVDDVLNDLHAAYCADDRPWILGFSGGKDSTMLAQLVYYMLVRMSPQERKKPVYVLGSDTRVETPVIATRLRRELESLELSAERDGLPITTHIVYPKLNDTFWVNLIGRGYPSPNTRFRWCTDRLKIRPVSDFVRKVVSASGAVVIVLGARTAESATRAQAMRAAKIEGQQFRPHSELINAWVYTPIEDLTTNEVWVYLLQVPSPWSGDNRGLITLYRRAAGGECPLVIDISTPSCGHSRFGCWTCTVVESDRSMESLVDLGEEHLEPLLQLRDYLKEVRDAPGARQDMRRNGRLAYNRAGELMTGTGPFTYETRRDLLRRLLEAQLASGLTLIEGDELAAIQYVWTAEETERQSVGSVTEVWRSVYGEDDTMDGKPSQDHLSKEDALLREICAQDDVPFEMMRRLREIEEEYGHLKRRHGLPDLMRETIRQALGEG